MTVIDVLEGVLELIGKPDQWIQGQYAGHRYGGSNNGESWSMVAFTSISESRSNCFCINGAIDRVIGSIGSKLGQQVRDEICKTLGITIRLSVWNDQPQRTHEDVLLALHASISRLEPI
jgi:hypothetical protein